MRLYIEGSKQCIFILGTIPQICETTKSEGRIYLTFKFYIYIYIYIYIFVLWFFSGFIFVFFPLTFLLLFLSS